MVAIHDSFQELTTADFDTYSKTLVDGYPSSTERKQAVAYLNQVNSADKVSIKAAQKTLRTSRIANKNKQECIDALVVEQAFDYTRQADLFVQQAPTDAELRALLTQDNAEVYFAGRTIAGDIEISGDSVLFEGGGSGSARSESLSSTGKITGDLIISGDDCTVRGVDFTSATDKAIRFAAGVTDVKFENCLFRPGAGIAVVAPLNGTAWFCGDGLQGNVTVTNCFIENFTSWLLADWNTSSATPTRALNRVRIKKNYWKQCMGSMAARGMQSAPGRLYQFVNNKFISTTTNALFWDVQEFNNFRRGVVTGNEASIESQGAKRGFLQCWSRSSIPWSLYYKDNTLSNFKVGGKIANINTFYAVDDTNEDDFLIDVSSTHTNTAHAFSFLYKKNDGSTDSANKWQEGDYTPENIATYAAVAAVVNPTAYSIVS